MYYNYSSGNNILMVIVSKLDELLEERGMTPEELATKASLPRMTIYNARKGRNSTLKIAMTIAAILNVSLEQIWQME